MMQRLSDMTMEELQREIDRLYLAINLSTMDNEREVLRQKWVMARSYAVKNLYYKPGKYMVEGREGEFTLEYVNGVMGWGRKESGEETAWPLALLRYIGDGVHQ
jgi:hypothetical protein